MSTRYEVSSTQTPALARYLLGEPAPWRWTRVVWFTALGFFVAALVALVVRWRLHGNSTDARATLLDALPWAIFGGVAAALAAFIGTAPACGSSSSSVLQMRDVPSLTSSPDSIYGTPESSLEGEDEPPLIITRRRVVS